MSSLSDAFRHKLERTLAGGLGGRGVSSDSDDDSDDTWDRDAANSDIVYIHTPYPASAE